MQVKENAEKPEFIMFDSGSNLSNVQDFRRIVPYFL
jgi:hypothetical protein